ncbi:MAG: hypothetical protein PWP37_1421 [Thermotogota bacterium]|nr:hypothetical protein [Thermotogota bacterium]
MMRRLIPFIAAGLLVLLFAACAEIPTLPTVIPPDPEGVTEPTTWGSSVEVYGSIDKAPFLTPLDVPDFVKVRVSIPEFTDSKFTKDNFLVFEDGKAQGFLIFKESEKRSAADIVFVVDVTGSMGTEINGVKNSLSNFIQDLKDSGLDVRVGVMPYGDYAPAREDTDDMIEFDPPFLNLSDPDTAQDYVELLGVGYGGDGPENAYGAIVQAWKNMSWRRSAQKIIILLTDAVSHYRGDGSYQPFDPQYTKDEVIAALKGFATLHIVASTGGYFSEYDTDFSSPDDPREIAVETGGLIIYQDPYGEPDLSAIGIVEYVESSWIIVFQSDSPADTHDVDIYFDADGDTFTTDDQGALHLVGVEY